ncbi:hypothetical protein EB796_018244 [Bugula neritina]|uniref:Uncharacterized protein n=1 Tax=Bugula neritina TaxID=10212 RepID=A0A7J7JCW1_BUGNE|nr:hypothetical protein EB796_018244 [Bugula neritina]
METYAWIIRIFNMVLKLHSETNRLSYYFYQFQIAHAISCQNYVNNNLGFQVIRCPLPCCNGWIFPIVHDPD